MKLFLIGFSKDAVEFKIDDEIAVNSKLYYGTVYTNIDLVVLFIAVFFFSFSIVAFLLAY